MVLLRTSLGLFILHEIHARIHAPQTQGQAKSSCLSFLTCCQPRFVSAFYKTRLHAMMQSRSAGVTDTSGSIGKQSSDRVMLTYSLLHASLHIMHSHPPRHCQCSLVCVKQCTQALAPAALQLMQVWQKAWKRLGCTIQGWYCNAKLPSQNYGCETTERSCRHPACR
jgi:hypothetical protein